MSSKIYKYFSPSVLGLVFSKYGFCSIKCSLPKDYNDPYELFLGVDLSVPSSMLAAYREIVQEIPQHPTSCFSKSPIVTPMWAHYANNHSGFVVEFDVESLKVEFEKLIIKDVCYRSEPSEVIANHLQMAVGTKKPRHAYFLQQAVMSTAYFSKDISWGYEQECRLLEQEGRCENISGNQILHIPVNCCSAIIVGNNADAKTVEQTKKIAKETSLIWFESIIGKSMGQPFLASIDGSRALFNGIGILAADKVCKSCSEPIDDKNELCAWCSITEAQMLSAAQGNPLRMLDHYGLLDNYYEGLNRIGRGKD
ncbi:DUF2971 domain-containing protein [Sphingomonas sp. GB1N7]|uniref:DUF2971 domain-containing protein n=1 Tax=Parasphingomonas caseinilytica TaxID=3096158 RepID=UPI002FC74FE9